MKKIIIIIILYFTCLNAKPQSCHDVKELLRKRHTINGMTYGHPYTMFDRHNKLSLDSLISNIRRRIKEDKPLGPVYLAYQAIYDNAKLTMPTDDGTMYIIEKKPSQLAIWAKNNAFVFLVGLDGNGSKLDTIKYNGNNASDSARNGFRDRAKNAFDNLRGVVIPHASFSITFSNSDDTNMQHYSRSLIYWLQAYDLLKAAYEVRDELKLINPTINRYPWGFADADRNGLECSQRNKLRKLTRDLYYYSSGIGGLVVHEFGWKKNHGIACASALLIAAQVLNDAGTETNYLNRIFGWLWGDGFVWPHPKYSPVKTII